MDSNYKVDTVYIKSYVNEISATSEVTQVYTNTLSKPRRRRAATILPSTSVPIS